MGKAAARGFLGRFLDFIERSGNRLPDPVTLFLIAGAMVVFGSAILSGLGVAVQHPADGRLIEAQNLLTVENIRRMFTDMVKNFANFPPLALVLVTMIGIGVAERSGLVNTALRRMATLVPKSALSATLVFGGIMSSMAADAGYVVLTPLGAVLFAGMGRHPLAGLAAAFAGVSGGFSANLLLTGVDPLLSGLSTSAAQIVDSSYEVLPTANYYLMIASVFVATAVGALVTDYIVEPRLGPWRPSGEAHGQIDELKPEQIRGLRWSGITFALCLVAIALLTIPEGSIFRDADKGLAPFYASLVPLIMAVFLLIGLVYGMAAKTIKSDVDVARMANETMATMGAYIVLAFVAAQFVAYFSWSNIGLITAVTGADFLQNIGLTGVPLIICFMVVSAVINLFIGSASAKWAIMAPVFIPMLMVMGYSPELVQAAYRIGDSVTNIITPLLPYFPIIIAFATKYDPRTGIGTLISTMLPYSVAFGIAWAGLLIVWMTFGIPLGPGAPMFYEP